MSANLMLREIGISIFLACVGLGAGEGFVDTVIHGGGYIWVGYGVIITILPLLITGLIGRYYCKAELFHAYRSSGWLYHQSAGIGLLQ